MTDVEWWRDLNLPLRSIIQRNGRIVMDTPDWIEDEEGKRIFQETAGKTTFSARKIIVDALRESGDLDGEPTPTKRMTNFYEKGDKPLEIPPVVPQERRHRSEAERRTDRTRSRTELPS